MIAFFADLHFQGGALGPVVATAWREARQECARRGVETIFVAGDVYEDDSLALGRDASSGDVVASVIEPIIEDGIRTIFIRGNHDGRVGHRSALATLLGIPNVEVVEDFRMVSLPDAIVACVPWADNGQLLCQPEYQGLTWDQFTARAAAIRQQMLWGIAAEWHGDPRCKILTLHAEIDGARNRYREIPPGRTHVFRIHDLTATGADHICAGHYHAAQDIAGVPVYVGSLCQLTHGEEGHVGGFVLINPATGTREHVAIDSPKYYTVTSEQFRTLEYRPGYDRVKVRDLEPPRNGLGLVEMPEGVRFEKVVAPKEVRLRANVTPESTTDDLLREWLLERPQDLGQDALLPRLHAALKACPLPAATLATGGSVDAIRSIRLQHIGPHVDTRIEVPETLDGLLALVGHNGAGKTLALEAMCATLWGEFPFYPGPLYDLMGEGYVGDALLETVFESAGRTYRAQRRLHTTAKTRTQEAWLHEITADGCAGAVAGPKVSDYEAAVRTIAGEKDLFFATVFQGQDDTGSLIDAEPRDRMALMRRWVGADRYEALSAWCKDKGNLLRGGLAERERRAGELADADQRVLEAEESLADQGQAKVAAEEAVAEAVHQVREAEEVLARLRADQLARDEISRQVTAAEGAATKAQSSLAVARCRIREDETELQLEPALHESVARLEALRQERAEAQRQAELVAAVQARRNQVAAEIRDLDNQIAAAVQGASAAVQAQRNEKVAEIRGLEGQIAAAVREASAATAGRKREIQVQGETLKAQISAAEDRAGYGVREVRGTVSAQRQRAREAIAAEKYVLETEQRRLTQRRGQLEAKARLLDTAGCKPGLLACPFIDDARQAPEELTQVSARIEVVALALDFDDYAHEARAEVKECEEALAGLVDPDPATIAPELRQQREALLAEWKSVVDPDTATLALDLRAREQVLRAEVAALATPPAETIAVDLRQQVAALRERHAAMAVPVAPGRPVATIEADIRAVGNPEQELGRLAAVREQLEQRRGELTRLEADLATAQVTLDSERARLATVPSLGQTIADQQTAVSVLQQAVTTRQQAVAAVERLLGAIEEQLRAARARVEERGRILSELEAGRTDARAHEILAEAFGATGIPQILIDCALPQVNAILADLATDMEEPVVIEMSTQRDLRGGGVREGLFINVTDYAGTRDIKRHSCGEQGLYRKMFRQGLALFGVQRAGAHHQIYCVDEPTLGLDARNVPRLLSVIYKLSQRFRQVWVVSHDAVLLSGIPTQFVLERVNDATRVSSSHSPSLTNVQETTHLVAA